MKISYSTIYAVDDGTRNYPQNEQIYANNLNPLNCHEVIDLYFNIEREIINLMDLEVLPENIRQFESKFDNLRVAIHAEKHDKRLNRDIVRLVCRLYLLIFDVLPVYNLETFTNEDWRRILTAKKLAVLVLEQNLIVASGYHRSLTLARLAKFKKLPGL